MAETTRYFQAKLLTDNSRHRQKAIWLLRQLADTLDSDTDIRMSNKEQVTKIYEVQKAIVELNR